MAPRTLTLAIRLPPATDEMSEDAEAEEGFDDDEEAHALLHGGDDDDVDDIDVGVAY